MSATIMDGNAIAREVRAEWKIRAGALNGKWRAAGVGCSHCGR